MILTFNIIKKKKIIITKNTNWFIWINIKIQTTQSNKNDIKWNKLLAPYL